MNEDIRPRFDCYKWVNIKAHLNRCREYRTLHFQSLIGTLNEEQKARAFVGEEFRKISLMCSL